MSCHDLRLTASVQPALSLASSAPKRASMQDGRRWVDQPQSALVLDDELFASAREQWHQSNGQASTSGTSGDYYGLLGVSKVINVTKALSF